MSPGSAESEASICLLEWEMYIMALKNIDFDVYTTVFIAQRIH